MDISADLRARIIGAADQLYEQNGRATLPTVDAVRRHARVDMNAASATMKEWRRMQTAAPAPTAMPVPDRLRQGGEAALASLWTEAQEIAQEALKAAQAAWQAERAEAETIREQIAAAFQAQSMDLDLSLARVAELENALAVGAARAAELERECEERRAAAEAAQHRVALADLRADHAEQRCNDLEPELARALAEAGRLLTAADLAATELRTTGKSLEAARLERDAALKEAGQAREETARLRGQLDAMHPLHPETAQAHRARRAGKSSPPQASGA